MLALLALAAFAAAPVPDYRREESWLCRPGRADACSARQTDGAMTADGTALPPPAASPPAHPAADCFYVYPTVSLDPKPNSDMIAGEEERGAAAAQFARFAGACRTFAPVYRQVTLTALRTMLGSGSASGEARPGFALAYGDVVAAWHSYLAHDNRGRPFVLIGHSQGSLLLKRLVAEEIDGRPIAGRLLSAILPGTTIEVPPGRDTGGSFKALPLCRADGQTGCVLTWASYRDSTPPPPTALFGRAATPGMVAACTNPAALAGGSAGLGAVLGFPWWQGGVARYRPPAAIPASPVFIAAPGLLRGACRMADGAAWLAVAVDPAAAGLAATLTGTAAIGDAAWPDWGWHVVDVAIVQDDLIRLVRRQTGTWRARRR